MRAAYDQLLRIRNELHFQTGRHTDLLSLELQPQVARRFGYEDTPELRASELLCVTIICVEGVCTDWWPDNLISWFSGIQRSGGFSGGELSRQRVGL
jgi:hypothetical protein